MMPWVVLCVLLWLCVLCVCARANVFDTVRSAVGAAQRVVDEGRYSLSPDGRRDRRTVVGLHWRSAVLVMDLHWRAPPRRTVSELTAHTPPAETHTHTLYTHTPLSLRAFADSLPSRGVSLAWRRAVCPPLAAAQRERSFAHYTHSNAQSAVFLCGLDAHCAALFSRCADWDAQALRASQRALTASQFALRIADDMHKRSLSIGEEVHSMPAVNAIAVATHWEAREKNESENQSDGPALYHVDTTGNYCHALSICVGHNSMKVNSWLNTEGKAVARALLTQRNETSTASDVECVLSLARQCLHDCFPALCENNNATQSLHIDMHVWPRESLSVGTDELSDSLV